METKVTKPFDPPSTSRGVAPRPLFRSLSFWIPAIICLVASVAVPIAFLIGAVIGNTQIYRNSSIQQQNRIEAFLGQHPKSFRNLTVEHASDGWSYPIGSVPTQSDYDLLADALHKMFGDELGDRMIRSVTIEADP